jgi:hypothetical protein
MTLDEFKRDANVEVVNAFEAKTHLCGRLPSSEASASCVSRGNWMNLPFPLNLCMASGVCWCGCCGDFPDGRASDASPRPVRPPAHRAVCGTSGGRCHQRYALATLSRQSRFLNLKGAALLRAPVRQTPGRSPRCALRSWWLRAASRGSRRIPAQARFVDRQPR